MIKGYNNLPWYVKTFYDKEKDQIVIRTNPWWRLYKNFCFLIFLRFLRKNYYPWNWYNDTKEIRVDCHSHGWEIPKNDYICTLTNNNSL